MAGMEARHTELTFLYQNDLVVHQVKAEDMGLQDFLFPEDVDQAQIVAVRFDDVHILEDQFLPAVLQYVSSGFTHLA
jgi:hypothetical protein